MSSDWRTDEPEVGQVCRLINLAYPGVWTKPAGEKGFFFHPEKYVRLSADIWPWLPITTPEEERLREEVGRLTNLLHQTRRYVDDEVYRVLRSGGATSKHYRLQNAIDELIGELPETEAGGG